MLTEQGATEGIQWVIPPTTQQHAGHWALAEAEEGPLTGTPLWKWKVKEHQGWVLLFTSHIPINSRLLNHKQKWSWRTGRQQHASLFFCKSLLKHLQTLTQTPPHLAWGPHGHVSECVGPVCHITATVWTYAQVTSAGTEITKGIWEPCQFSGGQQGSSCLMWGPSSWFPEWGQAWLQLPEVNHPCMVWCVFPFRGRVTNKKQAQWFKPLKHFLHRWLSKCGAGDSRDPQSQNHFRNNAKMLFDIFTLTFAGVHCGVFQRLYDM